MRPVTPIGQVRPLWRVLAACSIAPPTREGSISTSGALSDLKSCSRSIQKARPSSRISRRDIRPSFLGPWSSCPYSQPPWARAGRRDGPGRRINARRRWLSGRAGLLNRSKRPPYLCCCPERNKSGPSPDHGSARLPPPCEAALGAAGILVHFAAAVQPQARLTSRSVSNNLRTKQQLSGADAASLRCADKGSWPWRFRQGRVRLRAFRADTAQRLATGPTAAAAPARARPATPAPLPRVRSARVGGRVDQVGRSVASRTVGPKR
jgi:hypothetical protein